MVKKICRPNLEIPHKWFAWFPVSTKEESTPTHYCHKRLWWEWVIRTKMYGYGDAYYTYEEILK
jgi:hypothetical protein